MRKNFDNIEWVKNRKGYYVGYASLSGVWHIKGTTNRYWVTCQTTRFAGSGLFCANTLSEISNQLRVR